MKSAIYIHRYTLRSSGVLNASSSRLEHEGALIKVGDGHGCIHSWPELGDESLDTLLDILKNGGTTPIIGAALHCASEDALARHEGRSLFAGLHVPESHATLLMDEAFFDQAVASGFAMVKVKMGRDLARETEFILALAKRFPELKWRIDFNSSLGRGDIEQLLDNLPESFRSKIDFLEDPCGYEIKYWEELHRRYGIALAVDHDVESATHSFNVAVLKPAVNTLNKVLAHAYVESRRVVYTSYMDHPIGQTYAAWCAALAAQKYPSMIDTCGLMTHGLFEPDAFTERMGPVKPAFSAPHGSGLGFDDLLEALPWRRLI